mgnify:CR=1 FL=1
MKETKPKQQVDDQAKQLTQESAALKNKERMYKMIGAPWPPRKRCISFIRKYQTILIL